MLGTLRHFRNHFSIEIRNLPIYLSRAVRLSWLSAVVLRSALFASDVRQRLFLLYCQEVSSCFAIPLQLSIEFALALLPRTERRRLDVLPQLPRRKGGRLVLPRAGAGEELLIVLPLGLFDGKLYSVAVLPSKALRLLDDLLQHLVRFIMAVRHSAFYHVRG